MYLGISSRTGLIEQKSSPVYLAEKVARRQVARPPAVDIVAWQAARHRTKNLLAYHIYVRPLPTFAAGQNGVTHFLRLLGVAERRASRLALCQAIEEIGHVMHERVFVTDL